MALTYGLFCVIIAPEGELGKWLFWGTVTGFSLSLGVGISAFFSWKISDCSLWSFVVALHWTAVWYGGSLVLGTFPFISTTFGKFPIAIQPVCLVGQHGLEFLVIFTSASLACHFRGERNALRAPAFAWLVWLFVSLVLFHGFVFRQRVQSFTAAVVSGPLTDVSAILAKVELAREHMSRQSPQVIVFPANFLTAHPSPGEDAELLPAALQRQADEVKNHGDSADTFTGQELMRSCADLTTRLAKSLPGTSLVISGCKTVQGGKFAASENVVYGQNKSLIGRASKYPTSPRLVTGGTELIAPLIHCDMGYPYLVERATSRGANLVVSPSEDWTMHRTHFLVSVFRAVELRVGVARADAGSNSAIISPRGELLYLKQTAQPTDNIGMADMKFWMGDETLARIFGVTWFGIFCVGASSLSNLFSIRVLFKHAFRFAKRAD